MIEHLLWLVFFPYFIFISFPGVLDRCYLLFFHFFQNGYIVLRSYGYLYFLRSSWFVFPSIFPTHVTHLIVWLQYPYSKLSSCFIPPLINCSPQFCACLLDLPSTTLVLLARLLACLLTCCPLLAWVTAMTVMLNVHVCLRSVCAKVNP